MKKIVSKQVFYLNGLIMPLHGQTSELKVIKKIRVAMFTWCLIVVIPHTSDFNSEAMIIASDNNA